MFDLDGKKSLVIGGAYSVDKMIRRRYGYGWWADEQPSEEIKKDVEQKLDDECFELRISGCVNAYEDIER